MTTHKILVLFGKDMPVLASTASDGAAGKCEYEIPATEMMVCRVHEA